ncbi:MAG: type II toxin-antitoxin system RelE/ParE family toxin [Patescibacteria group bacterium]
MYSWEFTAEALKDFNKLTPETQKRIVKKLDYFVASGKPLKFAESLINYEIGQYRFRVRDYRVIFDIEDQTIVVLALGHRKDIYKG